MKPPVSPVFQPKFNPWLVHRHRFRCPAHPNQLKINDFGAPNHWNHLDSIDISMDLTYIKSSQWSPICCIGLVTARMGSQIWDSYGSQIPDPLSGGEEKCAFPTVFNNSPIRDTWPLRGFRSFWGFWGFWPKRLSTVCLNSLIFHFGWFFNFSRFPGAILRRPPARTPECGFLGSRIWSSRSVIWGAPKTTQNQWFWGKSPGIP